MPRKRLTLLPDAHAKPTVKQNTLRSRTDKSYLEADCDHTTYRCMDADYVTDIWEPKPRPSATPRPPQRLNRIITNRQAPTATASRAHKPQPRRQYVQAVCMERGMTGFH
jgi:hypothetical protein